MKQTDDKKTAGVLINKEMRGEKLTFAERNIVNIYYARTRKLAKKAAKLKSKFGYNIQMELYHKLTGQKPPKIELVEGTDFVFIKDYTNGRK